MSEVDEKIKKGLEVIKKNHPELLQGQGVNIKIDTKNVESIIERLKEAELEKILSKNNSELVDLVQN